MYDRNLTFGIRGVGLITYFALIRIVFDDWPMVKMSGNLVYVSPRDGDRLEIYSPPPVFEFSSVCPCTQTWGDWGSSRQHSDTDGGGWQSGGGGDDAVSYQFCVTVGGGWNRTTNDYRTDTIQYCATCFSSPELPMNWNFGLNIGIESYLKNGLNTIFIRTIVVGGREGAIQLTTRQLCPRNCYDQWSNSQYAPLEQRAQ